MARRFADPMEHLKAREDFVTLIYAMRPIMDPIPDRRSCYAISCRLVDESRPSAWVLVEAAGDHARGGWATNAQLNQASEWTRPDR